MDFPERPVLKYSMLNVMEEKEADKITRKNTGKWMHIKASSWRHVFMKSSLESKNSSSFILCVRKNGKLDIIHEKGNVPKITKDMVILASECGKWIDTTLAKCLKEYEPNPF